MKKNLRFAFALMLALVLMTALSVPRVRGGYRHLRP